MRLLLMGAPGAGKGTQAERISAALGVPSISTGDIFRANVAQGTELGKEAQAFMAAGEYVPDRVTNEMVRARLEQPDTSSGWLLDGYPRTLAQVKELDVIAAAAGCAVSAVVALQVAHDELVTRLAERAAQEGRLDDTESVIRHRQSVYLEQTAPLLEVYAQRDLLAMVDGSGPVDDVTARVLQAIAF
jgi:adenylate kinase